MFDVTGISVVVTGGTRGIGRGIAAVFARGGAQVLVTGRDAERGKLAAEDLSALAEQAGRGGSVAFVEADVVSAGAAEEVAERAVELHGGIDVLCANAGIFPEAPLATMTEADMDLVWATNVKGTMLAVRACLPALAASRRGRIVLTSSITGPITGFPGWAHYGASKAAQLGWMRTAAVELAPQGITVNAVLPGNIATEGLAAMGPDYIAATEAVIPVHRLGSVEDIGSAALFFASREAAYVTGQALVVDGGQVLPESPAAVA
ncbi:3-oxoacyl-ACP reductase FabG [Motilibacter rhizosphaerae]|nr:3-oxoacyl-ACP reductase FabG [Motilibacter rhizosphaerae]